MRFDLENTFKGLLKSMHITQKELAEKADKAFPEERWSAQKLNGKIKRHTVSAEEYNDLLTLSGVRVYYYDTENKKFFLPARKGMLRKVRGVYDRRMFSTEDSFYVCGDVGKDTYEYDCATELYLDHNNEFFLVYYNEEYTGLKDFVRAISVRQAKDYMDLFLEDKTVWDLIEPLVT